MKKTVSFAVIHFSIALTLSYTLTGSIVIGGLIALIEPSINTLAFYLHEKLYPLVKKTKKTRIIKKTISFAVIHFSVAFMVSYLLTGSIIFGSIMAITEPCLNTIAYYFHEHIWQNKKLTT